MIWCIDSISFEQQNAIFWRQGKHEQTLVASKKGSYVVHEYMHDFMCWITPVKYGQLFNSMHTEYIYYNVIIIIMYLGRILNRFSKDIGFLDDLLPYSFCEFLLVGPL